MRTCSKLGWSVLVAGMVGVLLLGSCSRSSSPDTSGTATSTKPYGSLTTAVDIRGVTLDPQATGAGSSQAVAVAVFDSITELDLKGSVRPGIAERWEISPDGRTQTFFIRRGVKFHDGSDLTGADVKFSIERVLSPKSTHVDATTWRSVIEAVELKDDYTVVLHLKTPQFELLKGFSDLSGSAAVLPKKYIEEKGEDYFGKNPIGSGPWKVVRYEPGIRVDIEAVENHWRTMPAFKNITVLNITEDSTKVAMLKTGELDIAEVSPDSVPALKAAGLRTFKHDGGAQSTMYIFYDVEHPEKYALGDVRVRKALSLGVNRQEMSDGLFAGQAEPSVLFYVRATADFWDPNVLKPDPYDPEQAKKLLAEAGYPGGFSTRIWDRGDASNICVALSGYWKKIGVNTTVVPIDFTAGLKPMFVPKQKPEIWNSILPLIAGSGAFQFERMAQTYHSVKSSGKLFKNLELDELIDKVPMTTDPVEKKRMALKAAVMAKNAFANVALLDHATVYALSSKIGELTPTVNIARLAVAFETITHAK